MSIKCNFKNLLYSLLGLTSTILFLSISSRPVYYYIVLLLIVTIIFIGNLSFHIDIIFGGYVLVAIISSLLCQFSMLNHGWKKAALSGSLWLFIIFIFYSIINTPKENKYIYNYIKFIKISFLIQIFWCYFQFFLNLFFEIDINTVLFCDLLGIVERGVAHREGMIMITGLWSHAQNISVVLVLSFFLFDNSLIRLLLLILAFLTKSSTAIIGIILCVGVLLFKRIVINKTFGKINKKKFIVSCIVLVILVWLLLQPDIVSLINNEVDYLINKLSLSGDDKSAYLHRRYYTALPYIFEKASVKDFLIGYGYRCSGFPFASLLHQYQQLSSYVVESDIVNVLLSTGIVGVVLYYSWIIRIIVKGFKINWKYSACIIIILIQGITYEIQMDWVLIFEMFMTIAIKNKIDIFKIKNGDLKN